MKKKPSINSQRPTGSKHGRLPGDPAYALERRHFLLFPLAFVALYALFHFGYFQLSEARLKRIYHDYLVSVSAQTINWLVPTEQVMANSNALVSAKANLEVVRGCDGAGVMFLLTAAILAFATTLKHKLLGIGFGFLIIYLLNQLRIIGLYFVVGYREAWFLPIHTFLAPSLIIVVCTLFFIWWVYGAPRAQD